MNGLPLALPSKGRMRSEVEEWLGGLGIEARPDRERGYEAELAGMDGVGVRFLSAREIAEGLASGSVHVGVTGLDLVCEEAASVSAEPGNCRVMRRLGFGRARLVVAVPDAWVDVATMADLADVSYRLSRKTGVGLRTATKYPRLTRWWMDKHRVVSWQRVASSGATEGAPAAGLADIVVDITSTGRTLRDNGLRVLNGGSGEILSSEACLVTSLAADWDREALGALGALLKKAEANEGTGESFMEVARAKACAGSDSGGSEA